MKSIPDNYKPSRLFSMIYIFLHVAAALLTLSAVLFYTYNTSRSSLIDEIKQRQSYLLDLEEKLLIQYIQLVKTDVLNLGSSLAVANYLQKDSPEVSDAIYNDFSMFLKHTKRYDQVRFIDTNGVEKIRVNYNKGSITLSLPANLQNKKNRYYFRDTIHLAKEQLYMSGFDLNVERGALEVPIKPTIRFATPVYKGNKTGGIVIVNLLGENLINVLKDSYYSMRYDQGSFLLVNQQGYYLISENPEIEFRFMFPDKEDVSFSSLYSREWYTILNTRKGQLENENGIFTYRVIDFNFTRGLQDIHKNDNLLILVSHIDNFALKQQFSPLREKFLLLFCILAAFTGLLSYLLGYFNIRRQKAERMLRLAAYTDPLTHLLNRRFFIDIFDKELGRALRYKKKLSVIICDIDHFKKINDTYGHEAGDYILKDLSALLKENFRKEDSICRWGGEEFVILLTHAGKKETASKAEFLRRCIEDTSFIYKGKEVDVTMSFGTSTLKIENDAAGENSTVDGLIKNADKALYISKKTGRNKVTPWEEGK